MSDDSRISIPLHDDVVVVGEADGDNAEFAPGPPLLELIGCVHAGINASNIEPGNAHPVGSVYKDAQGSLDFGHRSRVESIQSIQKQTSKQTILYRKTTNKLILMNPINSQSSSAPRRSSSSSSLPAPLQDLLDKAEKERDLYEDPWSGT